ncbi:hypothetical protein MP228_007104 [Amoeboaphelidium protococcarum]|nr:hypothetical protein MP228_007104 [Amoeboaphelidium protococcarum]
MLDLKLLLSLSLLLLVSKVGGDCYMNNPRGSNNKLNEQSNNVNNDNRLFDSQNNGNAGYQVGDKCIPNCLDDNNQYQPGYEGAGQGVMQFYEGSEIPIEWYNQHGLQDAKLNSQIIIQYMCDDNEMSDNIRDGTTTQTIPLDQNNPNLLSFGQHESFKYYNLCTLRQRNTRLFTADQNLQGQSAIYTRQGSNGERYGYECPEERDYYPYWHPSPWRDVFVCTNTPSMCPYYQSESQNVMSKGNCSMPEYNNQYDCTYNKGTWTQVEPWNQPPPLCSACPVTRNNNNGNAYGSQPPTFNWVVPQGVHKDGASCVIRIRYNISTADYDGWNTDSKSNSGASPIKTNPTADFLGYGTNVSGPLRLAINTAQFGRTFEDRSHKFIIKKRPNNLSCGLRSPNCRIVNLNVRGRRGNIQQTYPSVEYDFIPTVVNVSRGDYLHVQFVGSDANQAGNAGNGKDGTDRNNLVLMSNWAKNYPLNLNPVNQQAPTHFTNDVNAIISMAFLNQTGCDINTNDQNAENNCKVLNAAPAYYDVGLVRVDNTGKFYIMSTRNNAFTNREQKGLIIVTEDAVTVGAGIGVAVVGVAAFAFIGLLGFRYAKKHPEAKLLNRVYGTNKAIITAEFDDDENVAGSAHALNTAKAPMSERYPLIGRMVDYYEWNQVSIWFNTLYTLCNLVMFLYGYFISVGVDSAPYFVFAKGFGKMLDFNLSFILIPVMRNLLSFLRTTPLNEVLPLDENLEIHRRSAYVIAFCAIGHITCHYLDFEYYRTTIAVPVYVNALATRPGITGQIITGMFFIMYATALIKRKIFTVFGRRFDAYKIFLKLHNLWIPCYALLWIHGSLFFSYSMFPLAFMCLEKYIQYRHTRLDVKIVEAKMVGKDVLSLKMALASKKTKKFHYKAGQYLFLNCPDISPSEYHPFTITSAPEDSDFSCHIRCRSDMDWTYRLRQRLGFADSTGTSGKDIPARNVTITEENALDLQAPMLRVDGPYGSASEEVFDYDTVVLVGAGIGVTPFISILKSISIRMKAKIGLQQVSKKLYFYWICRDLQEFNSFKDLFDDLCTMSEMQNHLEINMYVTGELDLKKIKHERYNQFSGKPNWNRIFKEKAQQHAGEDVGVFLCGPNAIAKELAVACKKNSVKRPKSTLPPSDPKQKMPDISNGTLFKFHKENF